MEHILKDRLGDQHVEGQDHLRATIYGKRPTMDKGLEIQERNTVKIKNNIYNHICEEYIRTDLLRPKSRTIFIKFQSFVFAFVN